MKPNESIGLPCHLHGFAALLTKTRTRSSQMMAAAIRKVTLALGLAVLLPLAVQGAVLTAPNAVRESGTTAKADAQLTTPSTVAQQSGTSLRLYYNSATARNDVVLVFQLPNLNGQTITSANLAVTAQKANADANHACSADLYAVRCVHATVSNTDTEVLTTDFPAQLAYAASNNGVGIMNNLLPLSIPTNPDGTYSTNAAAQTALGAWLQAQYDAGAVAGDYVFLRMNVNTAFDIAYRGWNLNSADNASGQPLLTITTATPIDVQAYQVSGGEVWSTGSVRNESTTAAVGKNSSALSAGVMYFELPDLNGAAITSARFQFTVSGTTNQTSLHNTNMNLVAIRSGTALGARVAADYTGLGSSGTMIQSNIALWNDTFPKTYQTSAAADDALANWLASQYSAVGVGGVVYLRLEPTQDPGAITNFIVQSGSAQLIITSDGNVTPTSGSSNTVSAKVGNASFSWTFDRAAQWGHFIDGQPWVVMPASGTLNLTAAAPSRLNSQAVYVYPNTPYTADINITVKNPPFDHNFNGTGWTDNASGVFGWDSRAGHMQATCSPTYNATLGWDGITPLSLAIGDSITTPKSITTMATGTMPSRATPLSAMGVLTVLGSVPAADAFRPGVIRSGTDRTNPEILTYSSLINLTPYLISSPVGATDLTGSNVVSAIPIQYRFYELKSNLNGPWFMNTGYCNSEGVNPILNTTTLPVTTASVVYGGNMGGFMGNTAIGCLASWLTPEEQKSCRIRYIQRAIDVYTAVKAGVCLEEGAGIMPGYSTLLTNAGVMMNHAGMKGVNNGVTNNAGVYTKPYWMFADFATMWHTDGVPSTDLFSGEAASERLIPLYSSGTNNYPELNKAGIQPIVASSGTTMTMGTSFRWTNGDRPICDCINMKVRITAGAGAGSTIYTITQPITSNTLADAEKFRTTGGTLYVDGGNADNYVMGGKVQVTPAWANGLPDSTSVITMSIFANDPSNPVTSGSAKWFYNVKGRVLPANPATLDKVHAVNCSPNGEYTSVQSGGTVDNLIMLYAMGQQSLYKGGLDKFLIQVGQIPGYGEYLFQGVYLSSIGGYGTGVGNPRGAMWKQKVLTPSSTPFVYTTGTTTSLPIVSTSAKLWNQP